MGRAFEEGPSAWPILGPMPVQYTDRRGLDTLGAWLHPDAVAAVRVLNAGEPADADPAGGAVLIVGGDDPATDGWKRGLQAWGHASSADGSAASSLWLGGSVPVGPGLRCGGGLPVVVSYYTVNSGYEAEAAGLRACCDDLGLACDIRGVASRGSWEANCAMKAAFVRDRWHEHGDGVVWVDADARLARSPDLLRARGFDFGVHRCSGWQIASGTVCFWRTAGAGALLDAWVARCEEDPSRWDQVSLDLAWEDTVRRGALRTLWLPQAYTKIFDRGSEDATGDDPVIVHHQASRRLKAAVSSGPSAPVPACDPDLIAARRAGRPRMAG